MYEQVYVSVTYLPQGFQSSQDYAVWLGEVHLGSDSLVDFWANTHMIQDDTSEGWNRIKC